MFADERVDETYLDELKAAWRQRMIDSGFLPSNATRAAQQQNQFVAQKGASHAGLVSGPSSRQQPVQQLNLNSFPQALVLQRGGQLLSQPALVAASAVRSQHRNMTGQSFKGDIIFITFGLL